jgi:hypothetical protein
MTNVTSMACGRVGVGVICERCGRRKAPHGRSAPEGGMYCAMDDCAAYNDAPKPGCLWPGETCEEFGYHHCHNATGAN